MTVRVHYRGGPLAGEATAVAAPPELLVVTGGRYERTSSGDPIKMIWSPDVPTRSRLAQLRSEVRDGADVLRRRWQDRRDRRLPSQEVEKAEPQACRFCGHRLAEIRYGFSPIPNPTDGSWINGGCCVTTDDPSHECTRCGARFWPSGASMPGRSSRVVPGDTKKEQSMTVAVPPRDPERPQDDPWDANAVRYLLTRPDAAVSFTRGVLIECLRRQNGRVTKEPQRVDEAARLAKRHGVRQVEEPRGQRTIVRLYRTDPDAPAYPADAKERRQLLAEDK